MRRPGGRSSWCWTTAPATPARSSQAALAERAAWLQVIWLSRYSPHLNPKEREWRFLKRDHRSHLARSLRDFVDEIRRRAAPPRRRAAGHRRRGAATGSSPGTARSRPGDRRAARRARRPASRAGTGWARRAASPAACGRRPRPPGSAGGGRWRAPGRPTSPAGRRSGSAPSPRPAPPTARPLDPDQQVPVGRGQRSPGGVRRRPGIGRGHAGGQRREVPGMAGRRSTAVRGRRRPPSDGEHGEHADGQNRHGPSHRSSRIGAGCRLARAAVDLRCIRPPGASGKPYGTGHHRRWRRRSCSGAGASALVGHAAANGAGAVHRAR